MAEHGTVSVRSDAMTPPMTPGWDVVTDDGSLIAVRRAPLTEYQRIYGCLTEIVARDQGELWILIDAQTRLAERVATAEAAAPKLRHLNRHLKST